MLKQLTIDVMYQPLIDRPPQLPSGSDNLYAEACRGDQTTIASWRDTWIANYKATKEHFGDFASKSIGKLYGSNRQRPCIVLGSGPSLKDALPALKRNRKAPNPVTSISCLHNFGLFEDEDCHADYYLSLDAGEIVMRDISESRDHDAEYYWEKTKGKVLIAYVGSNKQLWEKWQGEICLFNSLIPDAALRDEMKAIEHFTHYVSSGGNAGGACFYVAKSVLCSDPIILVGMDCCFDYDNTFHAYKTHYDTVGNYVPWPDIYGIPRKTWQSYLNFKYWWDDRVMNIPGNYINASDGLLGAYPGGNLRHYKYMSLDRALAVYESFDVLKLQQKAVGKDGVLEEEPFMVKDYFENPKQEHDITFF